MLLATWVLAVAGVVTVLGGAIKFGMDLSHIKTQVTPNGGDTDSTADLLVRVDKKLEEHIESDAKIQDEIMNRLPPAGDLQ